MPPGDNPEYFSPSRVCECILCNEITGINPLSVRLGLNPSNSKRFIIETENLVLIPDISPIIPGHCLIVTKQHLCSFGQAQENIWFDLIRAKRAAIDGSSDLSQGYFFFEHGASPISPNTGGCIAHAHIHFIPLAIDMLSYLTRISQHKLEVAPIEMRSSLPTCCNDYLYYEDMSGRGCIVIDPRKPLPRQFVRMVVANEKGLADWDWRTVLIREEYGRSTILTNI